jgi:hypothetical protein
MKHPPLNIDKTMEKIKSSFPSYRDGGPTHNDIYKAGLIEFRRSYKYNKTKELYKTIEVVFSQASCVM